MKKILFCASTASHINNFHLPYLKAFHDMGYEVHVAVNELVPIKWADKVFALPFYKSLLSPQNILAIFQTRTLLKAQHYEKISSNTTLAGVIVRIAALFLKDRPRIYHIVHGYLFNMDSGLRKYLYLIPEKLAANVSDVVMVMNHEDYEIAKKYRLYQEKLYYIDGMGVDPSRFKRVSTQEKIAQKKRLGFAQDDFLFVYAAEFSKRKNQKMLINAFSKCNLKKAHLLLAGDGKMLNECKKLAEHLGQTGKIHFLGYVNDVPTLYTACDVAVSTSLIEGLPFNIIEAMGCGLSVIASDIKGHKELVEHQRTGLVFQKNSKYQLQYCIKNLYSEQKVKLWKFGYAGKRKAEKYLLEYIFPKITKFYLSS